MIRCRRGGPSIEEVQRGDTDLILDELVTQTYTLDQVDDGYEAMRQHRAIRGMVVFD